MTGTDLDEVERFTSEGPGALTPQRGDSARLSSESIRPAIRLAGARIYQIGNVWQTFDSELRAAINGRTAAVFLLRRKSSASARAHSP